MQSAGAGGRTRTDMSVTSPDFESGAYTNFATPALGSRHNKSLIRCGQLRLETDRRLTSILIHPGFNWGIIASNEIPLTA